MEFGKRHDATDTTAFCPRLLVTDLLYGEADVVDFALYDDNDNDDDDETRVTAVR